MSAAPSADRPVRARPAPAGGEHRGSAWWPLAVFGVGVLWALAYLPNLTTATLLIDERVYLEAGQAYTAGDFALNREHPPLAKLAFGVAGRLVGDPLLGGRLVAVAAGAAIAGAVHALVRRLAGRWWGLAGAALWVVLPHALRWHELAWGGFDRLDRYAMLDPVATALAAWALVLATRWRGDPRLRWGVGAGALVGLAAGAKLSGALLGVAVAVVPWLWPRSAWGRRTVLASVVALVAAAAGFALAYLPMGAGAPAAVADMVAFQSGHAAQGHSVVVAGQVHPAAPWWAQAWYAWRDQGGLVVLAAAVAAVVGLVAGPGDRRDRGLVGLAMAVTMVAFALSPVLLPHYQFLWLPLVVVLATAGLARLAAGPRPVGALLAVVLAAGLLVTGVRSLAHVATRPVTDYRAVAALLADGDEDPAVLVRGFDGLLTAYLPDARLVDDLDRADAVVLDPRLTDLRPAPVLRERLASPAWRPVDVPLLEVWVRR